MRSTTQLLCLATALTTSAFAQDAYAPSANVSTATVVVPTNCTSGCPTTIDVEPCDETPMGTAGTGGMPPATTGTWVMPTAPSATSGGSDAPPGYTGAAAAVQPVVGGLLMAGFGLLPALL